MKAPRWCRKLFVLLSALIFFRNCSNLLAETATGTILGTVKDPSGAVLAGVTVTISSVASSTNRSVSNGEAGTYSAVALLPGDYRLTYEVAGFGKGEQILTVTAGATANGNFTMPLASQRFRVEVLLTPAPRQYLIKQ